MISATKTALCDTWYNNEALHMRKIVPALYGSSFGVSTSYLETWVREVN